MLNRITVMVLLLCIPCMLILHAQNAPYIPQIIPPSPNAASLMRIDPLPVNHYTGTATVSIPLYGVEDGDITTPIKLSYTTGGIRLAEEAGWVGLGWALQAGGSISRVIRDKDDFVSGYFGSSIPEIVSEPLLSTGGVGFEVLPPYMTEFYCNDLVSTRSGTVNFREALMNPSFDFEADLFSYNFGGYSGKFIIKRNREVVIANRDNLRVEWTGDGSQCLITDEKGFRYLFATVERTQSATASLISVSTWYLTQIISPKGTAVQFHYRQEPDWQVVPGAVTQSYRMAPAGCNINIATDLYSVYAPAQLYSHVTLQAISFRNGVIHLNYDTDRADLTGGRRLNRIQIFQKTGSGDSTLLYGYDFFYSYFNGDQPFLNPTQFLRLRLDSLQQFGSNERLPPYKFIYEHNPFESFSLTGKQSFSIDHWGFYNGQGNSVLYPALYFFDESRGMWRNLPGANRNPSPERQRLFSLRSVTYPTGGRVELEQESHDYDERSSFSGYQPPEEYNTVDTSTTVQVNERGLSSGIIDLTNKYQSKVDVTVIFRCSDAAAVNLVRSHPTGASVNLFGNNYDIRSSQASVNGSIVSIGPLSLSILSNNPAQWSAFIGTDIPSTLLQDIRLQVHWKELIRSRNNVIKGGGMRIKSIAYIDATETVTSRTQYEYHYQIDQTGDGQPEQFTYGRRMAPPIYSRMEPLAGRTPDGQPQMCRCFTRYGSTIAAAGSQINGAVVAYSQVTETQADPADRDNTLGSVVYQFHNQPDSIIDYRQWRLPGMQHIYSELAGKPVRTIFYAKTGSLPRKVQEVEYYYQVHNRQRVYALKTIPLTVDTWAFDSRRCPPGSTGAAIHAYGLMYPVIQSARVLPDSTVTIQYSDVNPNLFVRQVKHFEYTNDAYQLLKIERSRDSRNAVVQTRYWYPHELSGSAYLELARRHQIATPVGKQQWLNNTQLREEWHHYGIHRNGLFVLPDSVQARVLNGPLTTQVRFQQYDSWGNLVQYTGTDGIINTYLWGYNGRLPVIHIKGASLQQVLPLVNIASLINPAAAAIRAEADKIRLALKSAEVRAFTYAPLQGSTSIESPAQRMIYHEYDGLGRLHLVRDHERNIIRKLAYDYQVPQHTSAWWRPTGVQQCKPCAANSAYRSNSLEIAERDANPNSITYGTVRWRDAGSSTLCSISADWQPTGFIRCRSINGVFTGEQEEELIDRNPCSPTYEHRRFQVIGISRECQDQTRR